MNSLLHTVARSGAQLTRVAVSALTLALSTQAMLKPSSAKAESPPWTNPALNTDNITVVETDIRKVAPPIDSAGKALWEGQLYDIPMRSPAIWTTVHTYVYLPKDYSTVAAAYDSLYLLHGAGESTNDSASAWSGPKHGSVGSVVDASKFKGRGIVIMPEGGRAGWYTNWLARDLSNHQFNWRTFHLEHLRSWVDNHFRTKKDKSGRLIAGLSMGGHGALSYAAQSDLFSRAASFSGPGDIEDITISQAVIANEVTKFAGTVPAFGSAIYKSEEGDFLKRSIDVQWVIGAYNTSAWSSKNPYKQAPAYIGKGIQVSLYCGYGGTSNAAASAIEYVAGIANDKMHNTWKSAGLNARYCTGVGDHSWLYWRNDLQNWLDYTYGTDPKPACPSGWGAPRP